MQTKKIAVAPIVLVGTGFWTGLLQWMREHRERAGLIKDGELNDIQLLDSAQDVAAYISSKIPLRGAAWARGALDDAPTDFAVHTTLNGLIQGHYS